MQTLALDEITVDLNIQARCKLDEDTVTDYAEAFRIGETLPAVDVFHDGEKYWLASGFHRLEASRRAGRLEIDATVHSGDQHAALWFAIGANRTNGLRLSTADKARAIRLALQSRPGMSNRDIARHIGVDDHTVSRRRAELKSFSELGIGQTGAEIPHLDSHTSNRVGSDGKLYPATRPASRAVSNDPSEVCNDPPPAVEDDPPPAVDDLPPSLDEQPRDRAGQQIRRPETAAVFDRDRELVALCQQVTRVKTTVLKMIEQADPLAGAMVGTAVEIEADNLRRQIDHSRPYAVCPKCSGTSTCVACKGRGWLTKDQWRASGKGGDVVSVA